jgi:glyoxylate reductase
VKRRVYLFRTLPYQERMLEILAPVADVRANPSDEPPDRAEVLAELGEAEAAMACALDPVPAELIAAAPRLRMIGNYGVGYDNIDVAAATRRGIAVTNTPGVMADATADVAWALLMAAARRVIEGDAMVRAGRFTGWKPAVLVGADLRGKTLGIIGFGRIGRAVAKRALGWDMTVLYQARRSVDPEVERTLRARRVPLEDLLRRSDFVTLHLPLVPETRHLIGPAQLALMKPTAILVNTARGPVVDERALVQALREGRIAGAGLDVYEEEPRLAPGLAERPNVVLLPHLGSSTPGAREAMARLVAENIRAFLEGQRPPNLVNPEAWRG